MSSACSMWRGSFTLGKEVLFHHTVALRSSARCRHQSLDFSNITRYNLNRMNLALYEYPFSRPYFDTSNLFPERTETEMKLIQKFEYIGDIIYVGLEDGSWWVFTNNAICSPEPRSYAKAFIRGITAKRMNGSQVVTVKFVLAHNDHHIGYCKGNDQELAAFLVKVNGLLGLSPPQ